jgi:hypothetical protein
VVHSWRGPGPGRPDVPLPPGRMPLVRGGRPLKRWIWVGAFGPDALVCAARVWVAGVPVAWWCAVDRRSGRAVEGSRGVRVSATEVAVHDRFALRLDGGEPHEVGRVEFGDDGAWAGAGGSPPDSWRIECAREHVLRQRRNLVVAGSELEQRFGAVTGSLPVAGALSEAWGVMERHDVRW